MLQRSLSRVQGCRSQVSVGNLVYFKAGGGRCRSRFVVIVEYGQIEVMVGDEVGEMLQSDDEREWPRLTCG